MSQAPAAEAFDLTSLPELETSRLAQRIAALLGRGERAAVPDLVRAARPGPDTDAIAALRAAIADRAEKRRGAEGDAGEALLLAEMLVALTPNRPEPLVALCHAARRAGQLEKLEAALATLAAHFPEAQGFRRLAGKFASDLTAELVGGGAKAVRLASWVAAAGMLDPALYGRVIAVLRAQRAPAARLARLAELCPGLAEDPAVREVTEAWHREALALPPAQALPELARLAALLPPERVLADMVRLSADGARAPDPALLALLRIGANRLPAELARRAERRWRQQLGAKWDQGDSARAYACFQALESLGAVKPADLAQAVAAIDELGDPDDRLPEMLERCRAAGVDKLPQLAAWQQGMRDALRRRAAPEIWTLGRRLLAIGRAGQDVMHALVNAAGRFAAPQQALFDLAERLAQAGHVPSHALLANARRDIAAAALAMLKDGSLDRALAVLGWAIEHAPPRPAALDSAGQLLADAAQADVPAALARLAERHAAAAEYLAALAALHAGEQAEAARHFEAALAVGLSGELADLAEREVKAASFALVSPEQHADEPAIVLIESKANDTLLARAGALAPSLRVCGAEYIGAEAGEAGVAGEIEFRFIDLPEVSDACEAFTEWAMRAMERQARQLGLGVLVPARQKEHVRRHLSHRLFTKLRVAFNFREAIATAGLRRAFFVVNTGHAARVVAHGLLEDGGYEVRVACGISAPAVRRAFAPEGIAGPITRRQPAEPKPPRQGQLMPACLPRFPRHVVAGAARPHLLLVVTSSRPDVIAPVPDLVAAMLDRWTPVILFLDSNGGSDQMRAALARDSRPGVAQVAFHLVRTPELWAEALREHDVAPMQRAIAAIDPAASRMRRAGLLLGTDIVDAFDGIEGASGAAMAMDNWARRATRELAPVAAVFTHSSILEPNVLCAALSAAGVPTFWLQMLQHPRDKRFMRPLADHHLLLDRYSAELWHDFLGVPERQCTVVGSLRISAVLNRVRGISRAEAREELGVAAGEQLVLIATQPVAAQENLALIENVLAAVGEAPGIRVLVKLHPAEHEDRIAAYARAFAGTALEAAMEVSKTRDIYRSIIASDLVVIQHSNVGIEALMMDRAALAIVVDEKIATFSIAEHGVEEAKAGPEAVARIRALLTDRAARAAADATRRALLDANPEMHDGRVPERIVGRIAELIEAAGKTT